MRILVTAASRHGATREIAAAIGDQLARSGVDVSVVEPVEVVDLDGYDAVVLGSAVYAGHWLDASRKLVERLGEALAQRPVWLFSSGPVGSPPVPSDEAVEVGHLVEATKARSHEVFTGRIDRELLGFAERAIVGALRAPVGDFRDWDAIDRWSGAIAASLAGEHPMRAQDQP